MDKNKCNSCGKPKCSCKNKDFTKRVIEIDNPEQITLMRKVVIPASMGDDTTVPPTVGKYKNVLLFYEANSKSYLYSSDGIPTQLVNGVTDYEQAVNLPQVNGVTLLGDKSSADLKLADAPVVVHVTNNNMWSSDKTSQEIYELFNSGVNVVVEFDERPSDEKTWPVLQLGYDENNGTLIGIIAIGYTELEETTWNSSFVKIDLRANSTVASTEIRLQEKLTAGDGIEIEDNTISISEIEQYAHFFDTVADMKAATNLVAGDYARTGGFHTVNDGGSALYKITDTGTANEMDVIAVGDLRATLMYNGYVIPQMFGAYGDGVSDDTMIIQHIIDTINLPIYFTKMHLASGLTMHQPRNLQGIGRNCGLIGNSSTFILNISKLDDDTADYRNYYINNVTITQRGSGDALLIEKWNGRILDFSIRNCRIGVPYTGATGAAIHLTDVALTHSTIYGNTIIGNGIHGEVGDANLIQKNMIFGEGIGIKIDMPHGCLNNVIKDNTITTFGGNAILVVNAEQLLIENNQIEYGGTYDQTSSTKGMIYLQGKDRRCENVQIIANNFGGGTHLDYDLWLQSCDSCVIDRNRFVAVNQAEVYIASNTLRTVIRNSNYGVSQASNPRTDKERLYIVDDNGLGTMGVWKEIFIQGGTTQKLKYMKDEDGFVHFKDFFIGNLSELQLCVLPVYFRPQASYMLKALGYATGEEVNIKIKYDGTMELATMVSQQTSLNIIGTFPTFRYL